MKTLITLLLLVLAVEARAAFYTNSINSLAVAQSNVNLCISGDTVVFPAGSNVWSGTLTCTNNINLIGAGIGQTILTDGGGTALQLVYWATASNGVARLSGITFQGTANSIAANGTVHIAGNCHSFRLDNCDFRNLNNYSIWFSGWVYGVVDHCTFACSTIGMEIQHDGVGGGSWGDGSFAEDDHWGTTNAVYIEDCAFTGPGVVGWPAIDSDEGGRLVVRFNNLTNIVIGNHGTETGNRLRGARSFECYENHFFWATTAYSPLANWAFYMRGGTGVIFSNTIAGAFINLLTLSAYREWNYAWLPWGPVSGVNPWDTNSTAFDSGTATTLTNGWTFLVDSSKNWTPNQWVGYWLYNTNGGIGASISANTATTISFNIGYAQYSGNAYGDSGSNMVFNIGDGYKIFYVRAALDQPGLGAGDLIADSVPGNGIPINTTTGTAAWPHETFEPIYQWGNVMTNYPYPNSYYGAPNNSGQSQSATVVSGRDWIDGTAKSGYTPLVYPHPLQAQEGGGSPTFTLTVINGTGSGTYTTNSVVSIVANSSYGQTFYVWTGSTGDVASVHLASTTVGLTGNDTVTATYTNNPGGGSTIPPAWLQYHP